MNIRYGTINSAETTGVSPVDPSFSYNTRGEVASASIGEHGEAHEYDLAGNSITVAYNAITNDYTANILNQYTSVGRRAPTPPPATSIFHDIDGNLTNCAPWTFAWDSGNHLTTVSSNGVQIAAYAYDCLGRRVKKTTTASTTYFFYDGWNLVREVEVNGDITNTVEYVWGKDISGSFQSAGGVGGLLYEKRNGAIYVPFQDAYGNIMGYWDTNGTIVAEYTYDAFGRTISQSGTMADEFRHRFSTKYYDAETGFYYYGYRYYFPELRRWLNRDPLEEDGGENLYVFCENNTYRIDYLGLYVNVTYDVEKKTLTVKDVDDGAELILKEKVYSGNGNSCCVKDDQWKSGMGPLPTGKYLIGMSYVPMQHSSDTGDYNWYRLYGSNGKGGYTYNNIPVKTPTGTTVYRGGFNLHTGRMSDGCVTVWSDVSQGDKRYPHSDDYDKLRAVLDKTTPLRYKNSDYVGWLEVK